MGSTMPWMKDVRPAAQVKPEDCEWYPEHLTVVVYWRPIRALFRKRYALKCWKCTFEQHDLGMSSARKLRAWDSWVAEPWTVSRVAKAAALVLMWGALAGSLIYGLWAAPRR